MPIDPGSLPIGILSGTELIITAITDSAYMVAGFFSALIFAVTWKG